MTAQVWQFDPTAAVGSRWLARADYPVARAYVPAASIGSFIYTGGGSNLDAGGLLIDTTDSFKYDPATNTWTAIANIPRATGETRAVVVNNEMWVLGGGRTAPNPSNEVDIYNPGSNTWTTGLPFATARRNFPADSDGSSRVFLAGGYARAPRCSTRWSSLAREFAQLLHRALLRQPQQRLLRRPQEPRSLQPRLRPKPRRHQLVRRQQRLQVRV